MAQECGEWVNPVLITYRRDNTMDNWIPVNERLPKSGEDVLICTDEEYICIALYKESESTWIEQGGDITDGLSYLNIVAWMPLPEPYKESR